MLDKATIIHNNCTCSVALICINGFPVASIDDNSTSYSVVPVTVTRDTEAVRNYKRAIYNVCYTADLDRHSFNNNESIINRDWLAVASILDNGNADYMYDTLPSGEYLDALTDMFEASGYTVE
jgi:hypothetical protein